MPTVLLDTSPLASGHAHRGIGAYTRFLAQELENHPEIEVILSGKKTKQHKKIDLIHYPYFDIFDATLPLKFFSSQKRVVTMHDVIPLLFPQYYPVGIKGKFAQLRQLFSLNFIDHIITDSEASKQSIIRYLKKKPEIISVVPLAANPELVESSDYKIKKTRSEWQIPPEYILYVGDINYNKNIPLLIKAARHLPEKTHLVLAGRNFEPKNIPEWKAIETQVAISDMTERVHFVTDLPTNDPDTLSALYAGARCYVQPSLAEGFGLPVLEAMSLGTPVVSSNRTSLPEVSGKYGVLVEPTEQGLLDGLHQVLSWTDKQRADHISNAKKWAAQFSWEKTAQQTIEVYKKVLQ